MIIEKIKMLDSEKEFEDPLVSPAIISRAIKKGILDAPHLYGVKAANGTIRTMFIDGMITVIDENGRPISERERLDRIKI